MTPTVAPAAYTAPSMGRTVTAVLRGAEIPVHCPDWCRTDHAGQDLAFIADLSHEGEPVSLPVPTFSGTDEHVLRARLCWWPFADDDKGPYLALEADGGGDCAELPAAAAIAFTDQVVAHAERIRQMAAALAEGSE